MHTEWMDAHLRRNAPLAVLLIEDDPVGRAIIATLLAALGCTVDAVASGEEALARRMTAAGHPEALAPDAILMDAQMPGLSGCALIAALRARSFASIYVVSASPPAPEIMAAADGFLQKPFDAAALAQLLDRCQSAPGPSLLDGADPAIDAAVLAQFRALMPEPAVREIYEQVVADLDRRIGLLAAAFAQDDQAEARRIGHAIKGGCGMAGAVEAARLGALVEAWDRKTGDNQLDDSGRFLRDLRAAARRLRNMLNAEMFASSAAAPAARQSRSGEQ